MNKQITLRLSIWITAGVILFLMRGSGICEQTEHKLITGFTRDSFYGANINDAKFSMELLTRKLVGKMESKVKSIPTVSIMVYDGLPDIEKGVKNGNLDMIILLPIDYIHLRNKVNIEPLLISVHSENLMEDLVLLVNKEQKITKLLQLKNRNIIMDLGDMSGMVKIWADVILFREGLKSSGEFYGSIKNVSKASKAVLPVYFKQVDACIVTGKAFRTMVELNPDIGRKMQVLAKSKGMPSNIVCLRRNYRDADFRENLVQIAMSIHEEEEGKQILTLFRQKRLVRFESDYLKYTQELLNEYDSHAGRKKMK